MYKTALLSLALLLACAAHAPAQVRICSLETVPWAFRDRATGALQGVFPEVVRELERRTGTVFAVSLIPYPRIAPEIESGAQDCAITAWYDRAALYAVKGEEVASHEIGIVPAKGFRLESYGDVRGMSVSMLPGLSFGEPFDSDSTVRKISDPDYLTGVRKAARHRVDGVAGAVASILEVARREGLERELGKPLVLSRVIVTLQFSKLSPHLWLKPALDATLSAMARNGSLQAIRDRHYGPKAPR